MDWIKELTDYERRRSNLETLISELQQQRDLIDRAIKLHKDTLSGLRDEINRAALESGEIKPCDYITVYPHTAWKYDDAEMLSAAKVNDAARFVRVVESLNKKELNAALEAGEVDWAEQIAEKVTEPVVRLDKLGDLLIKAEVAE